MNNSKRDSSYNSLSLSLWLADTETESPSGLMFFLVGGGEANLHSPRNASFNLWQGTDEIAANVDKTSSLVPRFQLKILPEQYRRRKGFD